MIYIACRPVNGTHVIVADPEELAEGPGARLPELDELMPYGVFEPVSEHSLLWGDRERAVELGADGIIVGHAVVPGLLPIVRQSPRRDPRLP
jgi:hypothetical protein